MGPLRGVSYCCVQTDLVLIFKMFVYTYCSCGFSNDEDIFFIKTIIQTLEAVFHFFVIMSRQY